LVPSGPAASETKFWEAGSSVAWNQTARELISTRADAFDPAVQSRLFTYLSIAQYNAVVAAEAAKERGVHASPAAAAAGASLVVLKGFLPATAHATLDERLSVQLAGPPWAGEQQKDVAAGLALGRAIGADVVDYAATDGANLTLPPTNPAGAGNWTGVNPFRGLYGARTLMLTSGDQFRPPPPPAFGSAAFESALQEVRALTIGLTQAQRESAQFWAPNNSTWMNGVADDLIVSHRRTEREAARVLALANIAGFDGINACFDAKFAYYYIRPSQADNSVRLALPLPNHPSYPSGHSCYTAAFATVLASAFPSEDNRLQAMIEEAGLSRMYAGFHYRFDCEAGQELGRQVARYVLEVGADRHRGIPLD